MPELDCAACPEVGGDACGEPVFCDVGDEDPEAGLAGGGAGDWASLFGGGAPVCADTGKLAPMSKQDTTNGANGNRAIRSFIRISFIISRTRGRNDP